MGLMWEFLGQITKLLNNRGSCTKMLVFVLHISSDSNLTANLNSTIPELNYSKYCTQLLQVLYSTTPELNYSKNSTTLRTQLLQNSTALRTISQTTSNKIATHPTFSHLIHFSTKAISTKPA